MSKPQQAASTLEAGPLLLVVLIVAHVFALVRKMYIYPTTILLTLFIYTHKTDILLLYGRFSLGLLDLPFGYSETAPEKKGTLEAAQFFYGNIEAGNNKVLVHWFL